MAATWTTSADLFPAPPDPFGGSVPSTLGVNAAAQGQHEWLPFCLKQLDAISTLPENWDSYGAAPPDAEILASARRLLLSLASSADVPKPHVNPTPDGGVQFDWERGSRYFELDVVSPDTAQYLYADPVERAEEEGAAREGESLEKVIGYVRRVAEAP
jgi:hypothetical protein